MTNTTVDLRQRGRWVPILVNRTAGPKSRRGPVARLRQYLRESAVDAEVFHDRDAFAEAVADPDRLDDCRCIVACGGDGTAQWVVNLKPAAPLAIFPLGSENLLARHLRIGRSARRFAEMVVAGRSRTIDLGRISGDEGDPTAFTLMATIGFDATVVAKVHERRRGHVRRWNYVHATAESLWNYSFPKMRIQVDDDGFECEGYHAFVFNLREYAMGLPLCPQADGDDRRLDLLVFQQPGPYHLLRYTSAMLGGRLHELNDVVIRKFKRLRLDSRGGHDIQADGDPVGKAPAVIEVNPSALELVVPTLDPLANRQAA
ncbi:diacylglycerol/lipid kinase family protein [Kolteria novifilia]